MSDLVIFGRRVTSSFIAMLLYVTAGLCLNLSQSFMGMDKATWEHYWYMQKVGFWLAQVGNSALMIKAFYSGRSPSVKPGVTIRT